MSTSIIGYPRVGKLRELKFATEQFFRKELSENGLLATAKKLRAEHWNKQAEQNITFIPSNDFSFYDTTLDTACLLNIVPKRYKALNLSPLNEYFAQARGYQGQEGDVHALPMKKWFNTNYHYLVPEIELDTEIKLVGTKPFDEYQEAKAQNIETRPVILGPFTLLKLTKLPQGKSVEDYQEAILDAYQAILDKFNALGAQWIQIDEPSLVTDLTEKEVLFFEKLYHQLLSKKGSVNVLLQTYFGDIRDCYQTVTCLPFDGIGLDFVEGKQTLALVKKYGFPAESTLFAGLINGKNIWKNHYEKTLTQFFELKKLAPKIVLNTSCSLLHVPYTLDNETKLTAEHKSRFAFAQEKLLELSELNQLIEAKEYQTHPLFTQNQTLFAKQRGGEDKGVQQRVASLTEKDFIRLPEFAQREAVQHKKFNLPLLPTTTIGSFPQTAEVRQNRALYKKGEKTLEQYIDFNKQAIADCIKLQEEIGIDVLVHGEFERNDMVEYFGESLNGFIFTEKAWVQSYGTRCVKPPIIWGDVSRSQPITVEWSSYAQSLTSKPVKGMLTGPVTILNWSFPREDISIQESVYQIGLAISDEVIDLEKAGINIIQIDEAALKEKLPLRREDWHSEYLDWAIPSFRLVHSRVKPETQIHTHMCYSEFAEIITDIDAMDADVISFEASRSSLELINTLQEKKFKTEVGPGVYDIHSPRIPSVDELVKTIKTLLNHIQKEKLWINPDCGLKTRGEKEVVASLKNLVTATKQVRSTL